MFRTCLPAGRYKENKKILLILLILSKNIPPQAAKFNEIFMSLSNQLWNLNTRPFFISIENQHFFIENQHFFENHRPILDVFTYGTVYKRLSSLRIRKKRCKHL